MGDCINAATVGVCRAWLNVTPERVDRHCRHGTSCKRTTVIAPHQQRAPSKLEIRVEDEIVSIAEGDTRCAIADTSKFNVSGGKFIKSGTHVFLKRV